MPDDVQRDNPYAPPRGLKSLDDASAGAATGGIDMAGLFSPSDFKQAFRLFYGARYWLRGGESIVLGLAAVATLGVATNLSSARLGVTWQRAALLLYLVFGAIAVVLIWRVIRKQLRWRTSMGKRGTVRILFSDDGVRTLTDEADQLFRWQSFEYYRQDEQTIVLVMSRDVLLLAPRRFLSPDAWDRLTRLVGAKLMRK